jgi:hypothetical protein
VVYLGRARGSNFEIETQVAIAAMLGFGAQSSREKVEKTLSRGRQDAWRNDQRIATIANRDYASR